MSHDVLFDYNLKIEKDIEICKNKIKNLKKLKVAETIIRELLDEDLKLVVIWNLELNYHIKNKINQQNRSTKLLVKE